MKNSLKINLKPILPFGFLLFSLMSINCGYSNNLTAQNLVPNGSFEEAITCPTQGGNVTLECANWYASIINDNGPDSSPDWFHSCSESEFYIPPDVWAGIQNPEDGLGYVGLISFSVNSPDAREIIGVQLTEPLITGMTYNVQFYVNNMTSPEIAIATNKLGFNFSTHPYYDFEAFPINTSHYSVDEIIPVSDDWLLISHAFTADSVYTYIHIGNFHDDDQTMADLSGDNPLKSYYAIDNVSVSSFISNVGSDRIKKDNVNIFPNPGLDRVTVSVRNGDFIERIVLHSLTGQITEPHFYKKPISSTEIDITDFASGHYIIQVETSKTIYYETLIKL